MNSPRLAIIIPVRNEAESLPSVVRGLREHLPEDRFLISVGLNGVSDDSESVARELDVHVVGSSEKAGYGHGCLAAINAIREPVSGFVFFAGDGANDPIDVLRLEEIHRKTGVPFVMGLRRFSLETWRQEFGRALPNLILGTAAFFLTGRFFHDLGPLRLIENQLFQRMQMQELTWGWTIEAQVIASRLGEEIMTIPVVERPRIAGEQKVSGVSTFRSARIGGAILLAGIRARFRKLR